MGINHWLKKFKETKKNVEQLKVRLYCKNGAGERRFYHPSKPIALSVEWDAKEFSSPPHAAGVEIFEPYSSRVLWFNDFASTIIVDKGLVNVDFRQVTVEKWKLTDFLLEEDSE